jgi:hypothetical protein
METQYFYNLKYVTRILVKLMNRKKEMVVSLQCKSINFECKKRIERCSEFIEEVLLV